ncbi:hypothetical protein ACHAWT_002664 [Skeletonema menzelii]
MHLNPSG